MQKKLDSLHSHRLQQCLKFGFGGPEWHQIVDISLVLKALLPIDMVMFLVISFSSFHTVPENWPFPSAFKAPVNMTGGSGGPPGAPRWAVRRAEAASN